MTSPIGTGDTVTGDFVERLPDELRAWQNAGVITPDQAQAILARYPLSGQTSRIVRSQGRLVTALSVIGGVLVALGVILYFAANWDSIPRGVKLAMLVVGVLAANGLGYYLRYHRGYRRVGTAVILAACIIYGAGIHLVAQVYHVDLNSPNLFLFWFLGVIPMAYLTRSEPIMLLGVVLFLAAVGFRLVDWVHDVSSGEPIMAFSLYLPLGLLLLALAKVKDQFDSLRSYVRVFELAGLATVFGSIYLLSFRDTYHSYEQFGRGIEGTVTAYWIMLYAAGAVAIALYAGAGLRHRRRHPDAGAASARDWAIGGAAVVILLAAAYVVVNVRAGEDILYPIIFNALLVVAVFGLLIAGYRQGKEPFINLALLVISVDIITRYFELSWGLFDRSLIFVAAGIILLGGGFLLETGRRKVLQGMGLSESGR